MNLLDLDCYSLCEIIHHLDIESYKKIILTCKKLQSISKKNINIFKWQFEIQKEFLREISFAIDRDNVRGMMLLQYNLEILVKSLRNVLEYIEVVKLTNIYVTDLSYITLKLLKKAIPIDHKTSKRLAEIGYSSGMKINHWFAFTFEEYMQLFICNVSHPERYLRKSHDNPVIAIMCDYANDETLFNCYNVTEIDWFAHELINATFSRSKNVLNPACTMLKKIFVGEDAELITPDALIKLATMNLCNEIKQIKSRNDKMPAIFQRESMSSLIFNMKLSWHDGANLLLNYKMQTNFTKLIEDFCELLPFEKCIDFIQNLGENIQPFFKINSIFCYGELLAYLPVIQKLLFYVDIGSRVVTSEYETISLLLLPAKTLKIFMLKSSRTFKVRILMKNELDFIWTGNVKENGAFCQEYETLIGLFESFIERHFNSREISLIPEVTLRFIFSFLTRIFVSQGLGDVDLSP